MKKQIYNPYLPSWEYIPDGEPRVFDGRVYVFGSHDRFNGYAFCLNDYVCWSAPEDDLTQWRYEGVIYRRGQDPKNPEGEHIFQAPDVVRGPDGRYYLYYVLGGFSVVSVAVCDEPAGEYEFYGYVHHSDGTLLGERAGDSPQFDPGVLVEGESIYLYTGFCAPGDKKAEGAEVTVLEPDMLTVKGTSHIVAPGVNTAKGTSFEGHEFFEASSIRKVNENYYFIYSSVLYHELCYAVSDSPLGGFEWKGVLVSNNDIGISSWKPAEKPMFYGGNNHGSIAELNGKWYIFYHRQTNGTSYSRQGCAELLHMNSDGSLTYTDQIRSLWRKRGYGRNSSDAKGQKKKENGQGMTRHLSAEEYLSRFRKEDRIYPVITLVFYYDVKKWDGAVELYDMFRLDASLKKEILIKDYLPNYKINLLDAGSVEDVSRFRTDLQQVFGMLKYRGEKEKLQRYMQENRDYFGKVDVETYQALGAFLHSGKKLKEVVDSGEEEQIDMCKALDDIYADGEKAGRTQEKLIIITRMIKEGMSASVIRKCTEATDQEIEQARNEMKSK